MQQRSGEGIVGRLKRCFVPISCCCWSSTFFTTQFQLTSCAKAPVSGVIYIGATVIFTQLHILETLLLLTSVLAKYASSQIGTPTCIYFVRTPDTRNDRLVNGAAIGVEHRYRSYRHLQAIRTTFYEQLPFFCRVSHHTILRQCLRRAYLIHCNRIFSRLSEYHLPLRTVSWNIATDTANDAYLHILALTYLSHYLTYIHVPFSLAHNFLYTYSENN